MNVIMVGRHQPWSGSRRGHLEFPLSKTVYKTLTLNPTQNKINSPEGEIKILVLIQVFNSKGRSSTNQTDLRSVKKRKSPKVLEEREQSEINLPARLRTGFRQLVTAAGKQFHTETKQPRNWSIIWENKPERAGFQGTGGIRSTLQELTVPPAEGFQALWRYLSCTSSPSHNLWPSGCLK